MSVDELAHGVARAYRDGLDINMPSHQYRNYHYKDETVSRTSYLYIENPIPRKMVFILWQGSAYMLLTMVHRWIPVVTGKYFKSLLNPSVGRW